MIRLEEHETNYESDQAANMKLPFHAANFNAFKPWLFHDKTPWTWRHYP